MQYTSAIKVIGQKIENQLGKKVTLKYSPEKTPIIDIPPVREKLREMIASMIDHTLLKSEATKAELDILCDEALEYSFASVCVNSGNISIVTNRLKNSHVKLVSVVGFPLGASLPSVKAFEAKEAIKNGAQEIDMVISIGALKSQEYKIVYDDILCVVEASKPNIVKVILETAKLTDEEKIAGSVLAQFAGAHFVKTCTGFGGGGATVHDIELMRNVVGSELGVKASGGIRTLDDAIAMIRAGANRLGTSASMAIINSIV